MNMKKLKLSIIILLVFSLFGCYPTTVIDNGSSDNSDSDNEPEPVIVLDRAQEILATMSIEEKIGQMFFVRCYAETAIADLATYHFGGFILFGDNVKDITSDELITTIDSFQTASNIALLIGVDEEGGVVNRLSIYPQYRSEPFKSAQDLYAEGGWDMITSDTTEKNAFLKNLGINVNLAPVADVSTDTSDYIYKRSFGMEAYDTAKYVTTVVTQMNADDIGSVLKHFPGYGNNIDTHNDIAVDQRNYDTFVESDFLPFMAGIKAGVGAILVSHTIVNCMDAENPASLSSKVHQILRDDLNFDGVIMTDDLKMKAIRDRYGDEASAIQAVLAGNDMIISTYYDVQIPAVINAYYQGDITEDQINSSVLRILNWKLDLGIIK